MKSRMKPAKRAVPSNPFVQISVPMQELLADVRQGFMELCVIAGRKALDTMMEMDMEVHHHEAAGPISALSTVADALPGLGIVAAVLGVVITMGALGGPPEEIGHKVAAALVGTFLGILLCYGFLGPLAANLTKMNDAEADYLRCLRQGVISFVKGSAPVLAIEFARRTIPGDLRPSFKELETVCRAAGGAEKKK